MPAFYNCTSNPPAGPWDFNIDFGNEQSMGVMKIEKEAGEYRVSLISLDWGTKILENTALNAKELSGEFEFYGDTVALKGNFQPGYFTGELHFTEEVFPINATEQSHDAIVINRSHLSYLLQETDLPESEKNIDHAGILSDRDKEGLKRGERIYSSNCINCHGNQEVEGSIPSAAKFWEASFKAGSDAYSMYQTITKGYGTMPPQPVLTPQEKYDVIGYIQHNFVRHNPQEELITNSPGYLSQLPKGNSRGPEVKPYKPWADMDYGDFLINTYELADTETGIPRYHSPGPAPFPDEDYLKNNFAYKGIAIRLDKGKGGVSKGKAWMLFDHDLMRVAGGWTGDGFIDWNGILLNDQHETYPRNIGKLHFETPVGPGWANPDTGSFEDPRFRARDGRAFGPLPKSWADYKGLYHFEDRVILAYSIGNSEVLEVMGMQKQDTTTIFTRTLNISGSPSLLKMRVAPLTNKVALRGEGATLIKEEGYYMLLVEKGKAAKVKLFISGSEISGLDQFAASAAPPEELSQYTQGGGRPHYPQILKTTITRGADKGAFAVDLLTPPFDNPWACRMKLSGIDFLADTNKAVVCATDGDIWLISGLTDNSGELQWQRIGSGLFQPLGIKVIDDNIFVICRDQLVRLRDYNGDMETDFYESFNHDHQVTDHFHEFAMGLQADAAGNLYYAKSGRHAREALVPQHGTLLKVSKDGATTDIIATGFRAANGVCINPDGSFLVTDQQGYWNPMNRINWVKGKGNFYGNIWGYDPPKDTTRLAMEPPMVWLDMKFDRSPSELLWVDSDKWGPLNGSLLSFSYGFGKIQLVLPEQINGQMQGGVIDLPGIKFLTGVMRGRFNPGDQQLYACGMSAWGTNQMLRGGGLYRIRYTGRPLTTPVGLKVTRSSIVLSFASALDKKTASEINNFEINSWDLIRSSAYGSDRYEEKTLNISAAELSEDGKTIKLLVDSLQKVDVMTIDYELRDIAGNILKGTVQNTIHQLNEEMN
ncbi:DUF6797 domain-containing protein [Muriicola sp. Z0-33]|uniref:DUF6797 domain-containing protein n=1 Tax=Muriicola sp. Z0-33 TaxID=2816957 RepID=UPI0022389517|nr:DUF6797 domain-containing protein [Muriicola sp. Z0-33]MCW5516895.1 c-type cytochrome [Muriicola sp. Z0-33]